MALDEPPREGRWFYGLIAVVVGIVAITGTAVAVLLLEPGDGANGDATTMIAVIGSVAAPVGTIVGAYFGVQSSGASQERVAGMLERELGRHEGERRAPSP